MNFGDAMGLIAVMVGLSTIANVLAGAYRRRLEHKERIAEIRASGGQLGASTADRDATIEKLEHRIRVLERIATDKTTALASQIEDLREPAN